MSVIREHFKAEEVSKSATEVQSFSWLLEEEEPKSNMQSTTKTGQRFVPMRMISRLCLLKVSLTRKAKITFPGENSKAGVV